MDWYKGYNKSGVEYTLTQNDNTWKVNANGQSREFYAFRVAYDFFLSELDRYDRYPVL